MVRQLLTDTPHALIAGTTGSGKSTLLHSVIRHIRTHCKGVLYYFDLKRVELVDYKDQIDCLGYCDNPSDVIDSLDFLIRAMEGTYDDMMDKGLKETDEELALYIIIDELAYFTSIDGVVERLATIGRLGRAAHFHLICATQDPSRKTLPAALMQNFTACCALRCRSAIESRQIIGIAGAEKLPLHGQGIVWNAMGYTKVSIPSPDEE